MDYTDIAEQVIDSVKLGKGELFDDPLNDRRIKENIMQAAAMLHEAGVSDENLTHPLAVTCYVVYGKMSDNTDVSGFTMHPIIVNNIGQLRHLTHGGTNAD